MPASVEAPEVNQTLVRSRLLNCADPRVAPAQTGIQESQPLPAASVSCGNHGQAAKTSFSGMTGLMPDVPPVRLRAPMVAGGGVEAVGQWTARTPPNPRPIDKTRPLSLSTVKKRSVPPRWVG